MTAFPEPVPVSKAMPVSLFEVSESSPECLTSIGEILVTKGLATFGKRYPPHVPYRIIYDARILRSYTFFVVSTRVSPKEALVSEHTVWDPPLVEESPCRSEPEPPSVDPSSALRPSLTLPACLKDVKVKVTHVTSPGHICVQLLQYDAQLKRYRPRSHETLK